MDAKNLPKCFMGDGNTGSVYSSNGEITIELSTGRVTDMVVYADCELPNIIRFDLEEYRRYYGVDNESNIDILDLGYWYREGDRVFYEEPLLDWRVEHQNEIENEKRYTLWIRIEEYDPKTDTYRDLTPSEFEPVAMGSFDDLIDAMGCAESYTECTW